MIAQRKTQEIRRGKSQIKQRRLSHTEEHRFTPGKTSRVYGTWDKEEKYGEGAERRKGGFNDLKVGLTRRKGREQNGKKRGWRTVERGRMG